MSDKVNYTNELTEIVVGLKDSLDKCVVLIQKISNENSGLKETNDSLNLKLEEISQEMADLTKVSFVSNLSKQISDKDHQIITLKRKLCKLESENKELTKVKINSTEDILIEVPSIENESKNANVGTSKIQNFIDSLESGEKRDQIESNENKNNNAEDESDEEPEESDEEEEDELEEHKDESEEEDEVEEHKDESEEEDEVEAEEEEEEDDQENEEEDKVESEKSDGEKDEHKEELEEEEEGSDEEDEVEFEIIKIKRKQYYLSNEEPQGVYNIEDDEDVGERIGDFINNKLVKNTSN